MDAAAAAAVALAVDAGRGLTEEQYLHVLNSANDAAALQQLNAGAAAGDGPRVVVLPAGGGVAATAPSLIEEHLVAPGRLGVLVLEPIAQEEDRQRKKRRATSQAIADSGAKYEGSSYSGRQAGPAAAGLPAAPCNAVNTAAAACAPQGQLPAVWPPAGADGGQAQRRVDAQAAGHRHAPGQAEF